MKLELDTFEALHTHKALLEKADVMLKEYRVKVSLDETEEDAIESALLLDHQEVLRKVASRIGQELSKEGVDFLYHRD
tara:strand:- start:384 stop:617 length:234 start_codon:yes stop_codon:yes gene_type:complete